MVKQALGIKSMSELQIRLLKKQREKGLTGFTIPYLIGACRSPIGKIYDDEYQNYSEFVDLLKFFQGLSHAPNAYICISECVKLKEPVAAFYKSSAQTQEYGVEIISSIGITSALFASSQYHCDQSFDSLVDKLWELSRDPLSHGKFSFEKGEYTEFTASDITFIEAASQMA